MEGQGQGPGGGGGGGPQQGGGGGGKRRRRRRRGGGGGGPNPNREGGPQQGGGQGQQARADRPQNPPREPQNRGQSGGGGREGGGRGKDRGRRDRGGGRDREDRDRDRGPPVDPRLKSYEKNVPKNEPPFKHVKHRYGLVIFDKLDQAKADLEALRAKASEFDQLNVVIRAEGGMDDPDLNAISNVKVFAGTAWALIHDRRKEEGWYEEPR